MNKITIAIPFLVLPFFGVAQAQDNPSVAGNWNIHGKLAGNDISGDCALVQTGSELTGNCNIMGGNWKTAGKVDGAGASWQFDSSYNGSPMTVRFNGILDLGKITGKMTILPFNVSGDFSASPRAEGDTEDEAANSVPPILKIGSPAPTFTLPGVDGRMHSLKDYATGRALVVIFSCNHCPTAELYEKRIKQLVDEYKARSVAFVVIMGNDPKAERLDELGYTDVGDAFAEMKLRAKYRNFNYPYLYDGETQSVAIKYGPTATPHAFVFDEKRILRYEGRIDNNQREDLVTKHELRDAIEALLAGKPVLVTDTPAVGCSTKWSSKRPAVAEETEENNQKPVTLDLASADEIRTLRSNSYSGKLLLVNVWATWCGPCVTEFPELENMIRALVNRKVEFVTLSINAPDEGDKVLAFLKEHHAFNRNLIFNGNDAEVAVKAFGTDWAGGAPYTVLIGTNGEILYKTQGEMDPVEVRRAILKNLADDYYTGQHTYWNSTF